MSIKNLVEMIKRNGLLASMPQLEELYQVAIENEQKLAESQREFRAADATIENLQMQLEKVAAENAGLKQGTPDLQTMMSALDAFFADEEVPERAMLAAYNILRGAVETPATDAFLAEVRAQGVEMFATVLRRKGDDAFFDAIAEAQANAADQFAAQIRKGVQS
ncbi:hypothetical protein M2O49_004338 [Citrobacter amalonaticus]|nr:hypothetical protein [Citrobacter amalonaticus]